MTPIAYQRTRRRALARLRRTARQDASPRHRSFRLRLEPFFRRSCRGVRRRIQSSHRRYRAVRARDARRTARGDSECAAEGDPHAGLRRRDQCRRPGPHAVRTCSTMSRWSRTPEPRASIICWRSRGAKSLAETVTDVLVERGDRDVALSVVQNAGAKFSETGYVRLVKRSEGDDELAQSVGSRPEIPRQHFLKLLTTASKAVRIALEAAHPQNAQRDPTCRGRRGDRDPGEGRCRVAGLCRGASACRIAAGVGPAQRKRRRGLRARRKIRGDGRRARDAVPICRST